MVRLFLTVIGGLLLTTCTQRWTAIPQNIPAYEQCDSFSNEPQMLKVPGTSSAYIIVDNCFEMDRERVAIATHLYIKKWKERFPNNLGNGRVEKAVNSLISKFSNESKTANAYTTDGIYGENLSLSGLTLSPGWIWIKVFEGERLCNTSFIHELVHVSLWAISGTSGDPDHLGARFPGWTMEHNILIQDTNKILCDWGI